MSFTASPVNEPYRCRLRFLHVAHHYTARCIGVRVVGLQIQGDPPVAVG